MMKDLISVIIPAYNAEKYIYRCVESVIKQSYTNLEIIVVNDGSNDSTYDKLKCIEKKYNNVIVVNQLNKGPSEARNTGINMAKGRYLCFVDADDYLEENMVGALYDLVKENKCGLAICGYYNFVDGERANIVSLEKDGFLSIRDYLYNMSSRLYTVYYGSLCNKIYDANIINNNSIKLNKNVSLAEDLLFNLDYLKYVKSVACLHESLYVYNQDNMQSITKESRVDYLWEMARTRFEICEKKYKEMGMYDVCEKNIDTAIAAELIAPSYDAVKENYKGFKIAKCKLKELYDEPFVRKALDNNKNKNMVHRIAKLSLKIRSFGLFVVLMRIWIRIQRYDSTKQ